MEFYDCNLATGFPVFLRSWTNEELEDVLTEAVVASALECARYNKGLIFTALSGGLDSSFCLAVIRNYLGNDCPIITFTVGASWEHLDVQAAKQVAILFNTNHRIFVPKEKDILGALNIRKERPDIFIGDSPDNDGFGPLFLLQQVRKFSEELIPNLRPTGAPRLIVHDGIDELLGGYWEHRKPQTSKEQEEIFKRCWARLGPNHLLPLMGKANFFKVTPLFPYLQRRVVEFISDIPLHERTSLEVSKIPLRQIAKKYLPPEIIQRQKLGFCDALKTRVRNKK